MQSKKHSIIESVTNTFIGMVVSFLIQMAIYPIMGIPVNASQNIVITVIFTAASIGRGFIVRRYFSLFTEKKK